MERDQEATSPSRRRFLQAAAMLTVGGRAFLHSGDARAAVLAAKDAANGPSAWPDMSHRPLGRTGWNASRLVFGCGASLMFREKDALLDAAFEAGINTFDVGYSGYYQYAEQNLAGFLKRRGSDIFLISKARVDLEVENDDVVTPAQARAAAQSWSERLDQSLTELGAEHVNAYYVMAAHNPSFIRSDEIQRAFARAKQAGKVSHLGVSTHRNAERVLAAAVEAGTYDLAMIAMTPAGWYDWETKSVLPGARPLVEMRPVLEKAKASGIALVGMKAARHISGVPFLGWWKKLDAFDAYYDEALLKANLSPFQRTYAHVLANGLDFVNADIQDLAQLQENVAADGGGEDDGGLSRSVRSRSAAV